MATSTNAIPRVSEPTRESQYTALTMEILLTKWNVAAVDAIAPLSGMDDLERFEFPIEEYYNQNVGCWLIVGRAVHDEISFHALDLIGLQEHCGLTRTEGVVTEISATNTANQIDWVMKQAYARGATSIALCSSPYHIVRCFATAIQWFHKNPKLGPIPVVPMWAGSLNKLVPEMAKKGEQVTGHQMVAGEILRFFKYSSELDDFGNPQEPDVANYDKVMKYMEWMRLKHLEMYMEAV
ncbi:MAG: hypothetical protein NVSMB39_5930 [Candidatus Saccharimonadales bacterium]